MTDPWYAIPGYTPQRFIPSTILMNQITRWVNPCVILVGDIFTDDWVDIARDVMLAYMVLCPRHRYVLMTNYPDAARKYLSDENRCVRKWRQTAIEMNTSIPVNVPTFPLPNLWIGTHVETQAEADERIPELLATPAALRFVHVTPRGGIDFTAIKYERVYGTGLVNALNGLQRGHVPNSPLGETGHLDWVIVEGGSDPMHPNHVRSLRDQCATAGVPFRFSGWGGHLHWSMSDGDVKGSSAKLVLAKNTNTGRTNSYFKVGASRSGRLLDGVEHDATPIVAGER